ncbi:uncharacterized protein LOC115889566 [Sitophilus oryzae]|uniref:Uncharacterized protein LOC115889566 n=1 Tax=Sitophilus oryzae TaxID=7048 RepID=A0A6J2YQ67_SITOR|nr:uncharacterized protein LOC115889566 [Sitophilus oryzae]
MTSRALNLVQKCLTGVGLTKRDINEVILVGGMTRMPKIRDELRNFFDKNLKTGMNPDEAVALGAAIQASALQYKFKELQRYVVSEVTPLSLGICGSCALMGTVIKKNTALPAKGSIILGTSVNDQNKCKFKIFEGERKNCAFNNLLGEFTINNLPKGKAGDVKFEANFLLNHDGILEVEAHETMTNQTSKLIVTLENYRFCQDKISNIIDDAETNCLDDLLFEIDRAAPFVVSVDSVAVQSFHFARSLGVF